MTIEEFIRARLTEDERIALEASAHRNPDWTCGLYEDYPGQYRSTVESDYDEFAQVYDEDAAEHIAHQDPASTLRDIAGKRKILAECEAMASRDAWWLDDHTCEIVAALAERWKTHPDYRRGWA